MPPFFFIVEKAVGIPQQKNKEKHTEISESLAE